MLFRAILQGNISFNLETAPDNSQANNASAGEELSHVRSEMSPIATSVLEMLCMCNFCSCTYYPNLVRIPSKHGENDINNHILFGYCFFSCFYFVHRHLVVAS
jgi:hypothetical protein